MQVLFSVRAVKGVLVCRDGLSPVPAAQNAAEMQHIVCMLSSSNSTLFVILGFCACAGVTNQTPAKHKPPAATAGLHIISPLGYCR